MKVQLIDATSLTLAIGDNGKKNDEEATAEYSGGNSNPDRLLKQHIRREYKRTKHPGKARGEE